MQPFFVDQGDQVHYSIAWLVLISRFLSHNSATTMVWNVNLDYKKRKRKQRIISSKRKRGISIIKSNRLLLLIYHPTFSFFSFEGCFSSSRFRARFLFPGLFLRCLPNPLIRLLFGISNSTSLDTGGRAVILSCSAPLTWTIAIKPFLFGSKWGGYTNLR